MAQRAVMPFGRRTRYLPALSGGPIVAISLADDGTFARASNASVFNPASGSLTCYADNVLRPGVTLGYTLEGGATNDLSNPEALDQAPWSTANASVSADAGDAPDGDADAERFTSAGALGRLIQAPTLSDNLPYSLSGFAKGFGGDTGRLALYFRDQTGTEYDGPDVAMTDTWQRLTLENLDSSAGATSERYNVRDNNGDLTDALLWGAQLEQSPFATSYMCDVSGSRVSDDLELAAGVDFGGTLNAKRFYFEFIPEYDAADITDARLFQLASGDYIRARSFSSGSIGVNIAGTGLVAEVNGVGWVAGDRIKVTIEPANGEVRVEKNGVFVDADYGDSFTFATSSACQVGNSPALTAPYYGEISDIYEVPVADGDPLLDYTEADMVRASAAYNYDQRSTPTYYTFSSGEARVLNDGAVYVEGSRENLVLRHDLSDWTAVAATKTNAFDTAPDGTTTATRLQSTGTGGMLSDLMAGTSDAQTVTLSCYIKRGPNWSAGEGVYIRITKRDATTALSTKIIPTDEWVKYSFVTDTGTGGTTPAMAIRDNDGDITDVICWGAQWEVGAFESEIIETSGSAVTRAADDVSHSAGTPAKMREDRWKVTVTPGYANGDAPGGYIYYVDANNHLQIDASANVVLTVNGVAEVTQAITFDKGQSVDITVDLLDDDLTIAGATTGNGTYAFATGGADWPAGTLEVGHDGAASQFFGAISQPLRVIP